ncbi:tetratricopeptide repeat protein [Streptomyces sp. O3]
MESRVIAVENQNEQERQAPAPPRRRSRAVRRALVASVTGGALLAGVLVLVPVLREDGPPPAPGPAGRAMAAAGAGAPASLADLTALIRERKAWVREQPGDEESWAVLGAAYVERGRRTADYAAYPKAERALRRSLAVRPGDEGNAAALAGLAALANARHEYRDARKWGELAVRQAPKRWTLYPVLLEAYRGLGDRKAAGRALERLRELGAGSVVRAAAAGVYRDRGWREDAAVNAADAAALAGTPAERAVRLHRVGELAWERGEPAEALRCFRAALRAGPDHHPSLAGKGRALAALGRSSAALAAFESALAKQPLPEYLLELGELQESLGMEAAGVQYDILRGRIEQGGGVGVNEALVLGRFEADHGDADAVRAAVKRLTAEYKRHPGPEAADALGWALHRAGDDERAVAYAKKAMEKGPRSALFFYHRGQIERALGRHGSARRHLATALRINPSFSPLLAPLAAQALEALGEPAAGGPARMGAQTPSEKTGEEA